jgi:pimeloyl-ACP methyl ester carboxylesterase
MMNVSMCRAYVDTRIGQLHVTRAGSGPQIVLLPAASQSHNAMRRLMACLSASFEVIALDTAGSGYSDPLPADVTFASLADAVVDAMRALVLNRPCLYGIHTGNKIAASVAARYPDDISALVLCGQTHSLIVDKGKRTDHMRRVSANRFQPSTETPTSTLRGRLAFWRELETMWWRDDLSAAAPSMEQIEDAKLAIADLLLSIDSLPRLYLANFAYDLEAELRRITLPTLVIEISTPHEDRPIGRQGEALIRVVDNAELVTFEEPDGLGLTLENRAEAVATVIKAFLASNARAMPNG